MPRYIVWTIAGLIGAALVATVVWPRYVIEPGRVFLRGPGLLSGDFIVKKVPAIGFKSSPPFFKLNGDATSVGGACLIADPVELGISELIGKTCTKNSECPLDSARGWGSYGYCDVDAGKCWVRPGPGAPGTAAAAPFCNRSNDYAGNPAWSVGPHQVNRDLLNVGPPGGHIVHWAIVACQNLDGSKDCGSPTGDGPARIEQMSENVTAVDMPAVQ
jgi:hypothetical protein